MKQANFISCILHLTSDIRIVYSDHDSIILIKEQVSQ